MLPLCCTLQNADLLSIFHPRSTSKYEQVAIRRSLGIYPLTIACICQATEMSIGLSCWHVVKTSSPAFVASRSPSDCGCTYRDWVDCSTECRSGVRNTYSYCRFGSARKLNVAQPRRWNILPSSNLNTLLNGWVSGCSSLVCQRAGGRHWNKTVPQNSNQQRFQLYCCES